MSGFKKEIEAKAKKLIKDIKKPSEDPGFYEAKALLDKQMPDYKFELATPSPKLMTAVY